MLSLIPLAALLCTIIPSAHAFDSADARSKSVYQLVTDRFALSNGSTTQPCDTAAASYCGGSWAGIENELSYIQGMGFDTIWISPIVANIGGNTSEGESYHGYWTLNSDALNSNFGSASDLTSLITAIHKLGMYVMVDVVVNHVASTASGSFVPDSDYGPFNASSSFHAFCWITNYSNQTNVEDCSLGDSIVTLNDIDTESTYVVDYYYSWIKSLISTYSIDSLRLDTVKHVRQDFWPDFVSSAGVYAVGEVLDGNSTYVGLYQNNSMDGILNYPIFYPLTYAFVGNDTMTTLSDQMTQNKQDFKDTTLLGNFLNNADNARFESYTSDSAVIKNAHAFPFVTDGYPMVYYGSEQGFASATDPYNRQALWPSDFSTSSTMYSYFTTLNKIRVQAASASSTYHTNQASVLYTSSYDIAIMKAPLLSVLTNRGSSSSSTTFSVTTSFAANTAVTNVLTCTNSTVSSSSVLSVTITDGAPQIFMPTSDIGSLCGATDAVTNSTSTTTATTSGSTATSTSKKSSASSVIGGVGMATAAIALMFAMTTVVT